MHSNPLPQTAETAAAPHVPETRGILCELDPAAPFEDVCAALEQLRERGCNLLALTVYENGAACYRSRTLRERELPAIASRFRDNPDLLYHVIDRAQQLGFVIYAHASLLKVSSRGRASSHPLLRANPKWIVRNRQGKPASPGDGRCKYLCPANPQVRMFLGDLLHEMLIGAPVSGVLLSDLSFPPGATHPEHAACFCENCAALVDRELTRELISIPLDAHDPHYQRWTAWRIEKVNQLYRSLALRILKTNPQILTGVIAADWRREALDAPAPGLLDWLDWTEKRMIDVLLPVYESLPGVDLTATIRADLQLLPDSALVLPLLRQTDPATAQAAPVALGSLPVCGAILGCGGALNLKLPSRLEHCAAGEDSLPVEAAPLRSALELLRRVAAVLPENHELRLFLHDVLKLLEQPGNSPDGRKLLSNVFVNLKGLSAKICAGQITLPCEAAPVCRDFDLAQRLIQLLLNKKNIPRLPRE